MSNAFTAINATYLQTATIRGRVDDLEKIYPDKEAVNREIKRLQPKIDAIEAALREIRIAENDLKVLRTRYVTRAREEQEREERRAHAEHVQSVREAALEKARATRTRNKRARLADDPSSGVVVGPRASDQTVRRFNAESIIRLLMMSNQIDETRGGRMLDNCEKDLNKIVVELAKDFNIKL